VPNDWLDKRALDGYGEAGNTRYHSLRKDSARNHVRRDRAIGFWGLGLAHETEKIVRLGLPRIIRLKENAPELDSSSFLCDDWHGNTGYLVAQDLAVLTKVRSLIHEEISLLTVLYFPFRAHPPNLTPMWNMVLVNMEQNESIRGAYRRILREQNEAERHLRRIGTIITRARTQRGDSINGLPGILEQNTLTDHLYHATIRNRDLLHLEDRLYTDRRAQPRLTRIIRGFLDPSLGDLGAVLLRVRRYTDGMVGAGRQAGLSGDRARERAVERAGGRVTRVELGQTASQQTDLVPQYPSNGRPPSYESQRQTRESLEQFGYIFQSAAYQPASPVSPVDQRRHSRRPSASPMETIEEHGIDAPETPAVNSDQQPGTSNQQLASSALTQLRNRNQPQSRNGNGQGNGRGGHDYRGHRP
jgi:hypothetical protein